MLVVCVWIPRQADTQLYPTVLNKVLMNDHILLAIVWLCSCIDFETLDCLTGSFIYELFVKHFSMANDKSLYKASQNELYDSVY